MTCTVTLVSLNWFYSSVNREPEDTTVLYNLAHVLVF